VQVCLGGAFLSLPARFVMMQTKYGGPSRGSAGSAGARGAQDDKFCNKRNDGARLVGMVQTNVVKGGLPANSALGRRVAQLSSARMNEVCAALRFSLGCDSN
jgi:hypothetical protein